MLLYKLTSEFLGVSLDTKRERRYRKTALDLAFMILMYVNRAEK